MSLAEDMKRVDGWTKDLTGLGFHGTLIKVSPLPAIKKRPEEDPKKKKWRIFFSLLQGVHNPMPIVDCSAQLDWLSVLCMNQQYKMGRGAPHCGRSLSLRSNVLPRQWLWSVALLLGWRKQERCKRTPYCRALFSPA